MHEIRVTPVSWLVSQCMAKLFIGHVWAIRVRLY